MSNDHITADNISVTIAGLRARARKVPAAQRNAHWQIAKRCLVSAAMFRESNKDYAVQCLWEARHHLNHIPNV